MSRVSRLFVARVPRVGCSIRLWWAGLAVGAIFAKNPISRCLYQRLLHARMRAVE